jgi:hypothetical protein
MTIGDFIRKMTVPHGYVQDTLTLGPDLSNGWKTDAWQASDNGRGYFLRAWNDTTGEVAVAQSETSYEVVVNALRQKVAKGGDCKVTVAIGK